MEHEDKMTITPLSEFEIKQVQASCWADGTDVIKADRLRELFAELKKQRFDCEEIDDFDGDIGRTGFLYWNQVENLFAPLIKQSAEGVTSAEEEKK